MKAIHYFLFDLAQELKRNGVSLKKVNPNAMVRLLALDLENNFLLGRKDLSHICEKMYANAECYNTREVGPYEVHKNFIDVQCVLEGKEEIELCPVDKLSVTEEYDAARDIAFYDGSTPCTDKVVLEAGECCVIEPGMGHKPCMDHEGRHFVKKVVFKIPIEALEG